MKTLIKFCCFLMLFCINACNGGQEEIEETSDGIVPSSLVGRTLIMRRSNQVYLSVTHTKDGVVVNSNTVDYLKYPPKYTYKKMSKTSAKYQLEVTKKTYLPYYGTEHYSKFKFDYTLTADPSKTSGTFSGYETNANGEAKYKTGTFEIR